ncbi:cobalt-precorrin-6A synthase [Methanobrevibacter cuticularis]|uniref:Cobalt-precorrin-5B C(1)-methyltransferase n=1 Tax=Methanobrevibacter cuticularis TaxID=47311 RepID=A0A166F700_9EURY|nr:cobalt-precorrin-5B (C(1))-methyltransferase CbiD [Methanobrevibacter cuticularis]KZX17380.1 cobalt-precorrin-6A synthase [Methanobrevibacter cuticularis]
MINDGKITDSKELKPIYGLTTGSLATASSIAALKTILTDETIELVNIITPFEEINVEIAKCEKIAKNKAIASSVKYPYNDPDVTVNLDIVAIVELLNKNKDDNVEKNVIITGGKGVGTITKPGLQIPVNHPAINPVPLSMITNNIEKYLPEDKIAKVEITIPNGEKIAKKTMNPRLGIIGGISILGTTGIARSMSNKAYKKSLLCQLDIAIAEGYKKDSFVFVPGNIGEKLALKELSIDKDQVIQMGNFIGFMLEEAKKRGINKLTLFGHIGKLVKIAGGIFNTKHAIADGRREIIAAHAGLLGANSQTIEKIFNSKTTEEMIAILKEEDLDKEVSNSISLTIKERCLSQFNIDTDVILVDMKGTRLNSK